jgi:protein-S-isoprenylcysteine O-methyltransferase Ste14
MITKAVSLAGYLIAVIGLLILIEKKLIISTNPVAIVIQLSAIGLMVWSRITFGLRSFHPAANTTKGALITHGPYKWLRHPIYASVIYFTWACFIGYPLLTTFFAAVMITSGLFVRMILEERDLKNTYPEYESYSQRTKRIIPFLL